MDRISANFIKISNVAVTHKQQWFTLSQNTVASISFHFVRQDQRKFRDLG